MPLTGNSENYIVVRHGTRSHGGAVQPEQTSCRVFMRLVSAPGHALKTKPLSVTPAATKQNTKRRLERKRPQRSNPQVGASGSIIYLNVEKGLITFKLRMPFPIPTHETMGSDFKPARSLTTMKTGYFISDHRKIKNVSKLLENWHQVILVHVLWDLTHKEFNSILILNVEEYQGKRADRSHQSEDGSVT